MLTRRECLRRSLAIGRSVLRASQRHVECLHIGALLRTRDDPRQRAGAYGSQTRFRGSRERVLCDVRASSHTDRAHPSAMLELMPRSLSLLALLVTTHAALAQTVIRGRVAGPGDTPISAATINVIVAGEAPRSATTTATGHVLGLRCPPRTATPLASPPSALRRSSDKSCVAASTRSSSTSRSCAR